LIERFGGFAVLPVNQNKEQTLILMKNHSPSIQNDLKSLAEDAQDLIAATTDVASEGVAQARKRLAAALERAGETWGAAQEKVVDGAKATDQLIRDNPYPSIGIAFGVGAVLGFLLSRRG
jgi:ElaB/YqjD/DUF883 family membrane-anchored ribosome-binding protein